MGDERQGEQEQERGDREETLAERRRRLAAVFGDLPETTSDERDPREGGSRSSDDWLREQVPPHHGD